MLHRYLVAEALKLRRSLALLLCLAAPSCVSGLAVLVYLRSERGGQVGEFVLAVASLWGFVMLPLTITALGVLLAQLEHGPRSWLHLLTLPGARLWAWPAKALAMMGLIGAMSALLWVETWLGSGLILALRGDMTGAFHGSGFARLLAAMAGAAGLVAMLQLWVALRFRSFVPPLVFGVAGTFVAIVAASAEEAIYVPWLMPAKVLSAPETQQFVIALGGLGGVAVLLAMTMDLRRREA